MFTGCASPSAWTARDHNGRPVQTWERLGPTTHHRIDPVAGSLRSHDAGYPTERADRERARELAYEVMRRRRMQQ